jgi:hypothetical protein
MNAYQKSLGVKNGLPLWKVKERLSQKVYFIRCENYIRIGKTSNIKSRLQNLKSSNPHKMELLGTISFLISKQDAREIDPYDVKKRLHNYLKNYHHRGEWYKAKPEVLSCIEECLRDTSLELIREVGR